jgi:hypothetical protein
MVAGSEVINIDGSYEGYIYTALCHKCWAISISEK